jgi:anti-repressor protein
MEGGIKIEKNKELMVFESSEFGKIRVIEKNGESWFVAKDVATILGYETPQKMYQRLEKEDKVNIDPQALEYQGLCQNGITLESNINIRILTLINESGLYDAIFGSTLATAKQFKKWVTSEVLPTIRKHGTYMTEEVIEKTLTDPDFIIQLATQLKEERQKRLLAEQTIEEQKPLVGFAETCLKSNDNVLMRELSKVAKDEGIEIGQNRLYDKLREWGLIMKGSTEPYQYGMERNWFVVEEKSVNTPYGVKLTRTTKVMPKGQVYIIEKLKKEINN